MMRSKLRGLADNIVDAAIEYYEHGDPSGKYGYCTSDRPCQHIEPLLSAIEEYLAVAIEPGD